MIAVLFYAASREGATYIGFSTLKLVYTSVFSIKIVCTTSNELIFTLYYMKAMTGRARMIICNRNNVRRSPCQLSVNNRQMAKTAEILLVCSTTDYFIVPLPFVCST